jgi:hypothetical protein
MAIPRSTARALVPLVALTLVGAACGSSSAKGSAGPTTAAPAAATTAAPTTAAPATTVAPTTVAPTTAAPAVRYEIQAVTAVRPLIDKLTSALKAGDLAAAKDAYEAYDAAWNGTEVYTNFRSKDLYTQLEVDIQNKLGDELAKPTPDLAAAAVLSDAMGKKYDEVITLVKNGAPLNPLFDDVALVRIVRADLRITTSAINANDLAKVKSHYATFKGNVSKSLALFKIRSAANVDDVNAALAAVDAKIATGTADELKPLVAALTTRYNFGVALINAAARNTDATKTTYTDADIATLKALNDITIQLNKSYTAWTATDYATSGAAATLAAGDAFTKVQPTLAAKNGTDVALKTALTGYATLAAAAGDAGKLKAAQRTATDAVLVAQQVIVGQFWSDAKLQAAIAALPKA